MEWEGVLLSAMSRVVLKAIEKLKLHWRVSASQERQREAGFSISVLPWPLSFRGGGGGGFFFSPFSFSICTELKKARLPAVPFTCAVLCLISEFEHFPERRNCFLSTVIQFGLKRFLGKSRKPDTPKILFGNNW